MNAVAEARKAEHAERARRDALFHYRAKVEALAKRVAGLRKGGPAGELPRAEEELAQARAELAKLETEEEA